MSATILVVDDLLPNVKLLEAKLMSEYYNVLTARSGKEALQVLADNKVDIVLLDVMMPEMDGYETCRHIKENPLTAPIPVVMVTALSDVEDKIKGLEAGADEFLTKPVNDTALFARIRSLSRIKTMIDELMLRNKTDSQLGVDDNEWLKIQDFSNKRVVIIDDDYIQAENIANAVKKLTQNTDIIDEACEDLELIADKKPDMLILSVEIDDIDSLRLLVQIRSHPELKQVAILLLAEEQNIGKVVKGLEIGANDYFIWPVDDNELLARIKTQLKRQDYQNALRENLEESVALSVKDGLTSVYNRRYFDKHLPKLIEKAFETGKPLTLMLLDIDNFKSVNDTHGHQAGDDILIEYAVRIQKSIRLTDMLARYGGEEFVVVLSDANMDEGAMVAERIRDSIARKAFAINSGEKELNLTVSIGLADLRPSESMESLISRSDDALYKAKDTGKNKVVESR